jgi:hypothetical protein
MKKANKKKSNLVRLKNKKVSQKNLKNKSKKNNSNSPTLSLLAPQNQIELESKYCSCLQKVSQQKISNPYGICTQSIFGSRGSVRDKVVDCQPYYDYSKMTVKNLKKKAKEKKLLNYSTMKKKELVKKLEKLIK